MTEARPAQIARGVLRAGEGRLRPTQLARQVLQGGGGVDPAQLARAVLRDGAAHVQVSQVYRQVLRTRRDSPYPNFPVRLFCPPGLQVALPGAAIAGGQPLARDQALEAMDAGGRWVMVFDEAPLLDRDQVLPWRSFVAAADQGVMPLVIPLWDRRYQPFAVSAYSGASRFGLDVWRDTPLFDATEAPAALLEAAPYQATTIRFAFGGPVGPEAGHHFSIYGPRFGWRLYRLIRCEAVEGVIEAEIRPPLREWAGAGHPLNFDSPRCTMRADGDLGEQLERLRLGRGGARFVESFARYP